MARKKRKDRGKLNKRIRGQVTAAIARGLQENPKGYAELVDAGLIDPETFSAAVESGDLGTVIRQFKDGVVALAKEEPSKLEDLHIRPLEVLPAPRVTAAIEESAGPDVVQIERTIVFSDLEGFTAYTREQGDVEASALLTDHYAAVDGITSGRGGSVIKRLGDGHMLAFARPEAAVLASLELVEESPSGLNLRTGAHQGRVIEMSDDLFGDVVNVAARVTDLADGGESLVTAIVRDAAGPIRTVEFGSPSLQQLQGIDTAVEVCEVRSA